MKNYFIIHGSFGDSKEHYLPWLKNELEKLGEIVCVDFPIGVGVQTFESWSKVLDQYKNKITQDTVFIGRSIGPIFAIKYLMKNNIPYQQYIDNGYFKVIEQIYKTPYGNKINVKTLINPIGQIKLIEKLRKLYGDD